MRSTKKKIWELVRSDHAEAEAAKALGLSVEALGGKIQQLYLVDDYDSMIRLVRQHQVNRMFSSLDSQEKQ